MGKKKKNRRSSSSSSTKKSPAKSAFAGSLAEQLAGKKITPSQRSAQDAARASPSAPPPSDEPAAPPEELLDGEELFLAALDQMPSPSPAQKRKGSSPFRGDFADQLTGHVPIEERRKEEDSARAEQATQDAQQGQAKEKREEAHAPAQAKTTPPRELSEGELFEHALDTMKPTDIFVGKYHGRVQNIPEPKQKKLPFTKESGAQVAKKMSRAEREEAEARAREEIAERREEAMFTHAVGPLDEIFSGQEKYHRQKPRQRSVEEERERGYTSDTPEGLITPPLPKSGDGLHRVDELHPSYRGLLNRAKLWGRKNQLQTINVRGDSVEDALRQIELFMHQQWKDEALYVRVVHGRGLQSEEGIPVLKPSILHWLEGPGYRYVRGYAPELTQDRDYGSVIVCLTKRERDEEDEKKKRKRGRGKKQQGRKGAKTTKGGTKST